MMNKLLLGLLAFSATAQAVDQDLASWTMLSAQGPVLGNFQAYMEVQPRVGNDVSRLNALIVRPGLGYKFAPNATMWLGYAYLPTFQGNRSAEHRIWQQYLGSSTLGPFATGLRSRLEQRFLPQLTGPSLRFRQLGRLSLPISPAKAWSIAAWDELFLNINTIGSGPKAGFDQNRFFLGPTYQATQELRVDLGYLNQYVSGQSQRPGQLNHALFVWASYNW